MNFFTKVITLFVTIVTLTVLFMNYAFDPQIEKILESALYEESQVIIGSMDLSLSHLIENDEDIELQELLSRLGQYERIDNVLVINSEYDVLFSSNNKEIGTHIESPFLREVVENNLPQNIINDIDNRKYMIASPIHLDSHISSSNSSDYFLCLTLDSNMISKRFNRLTHNIHMISIFVGVIFILITIAMLYRFIQKPLLKFMYAAEKISKNEYDTRVDIDSKDEWEKLSSSFNKMAKNIEANNKSLLLDKNKAENENNLKSEFLANMSHEIRTPLNTILGFSELLYEKEVDEEKRESLKIVNNSGRYLLSLINDVLDFSKINSDKILLESAPFIVEDFVDEIKNMFVLKIKEKDLDFICNISPMVPQVLIGDIYRLKQIIINLISNSIKFTNHGSISLDLNYVNNQLVVLVTDTGIGIPEENRQKIFNMFEQSSVDTTRLYGGSGLGLAIVKKLVELMDGHILLYSEVNRGTKIKITLSLKEGSIEEISQKINHENFVNHWLSKNPDLRSQMYESILEISDIRINLSNSIAQKDINNSTRHNNTILRIASNYSMKEIVNMSKRIELFLKNDNIQWESISLLEESLKFLLEEIIEKVQPINRYLDKKTPEILIAEDVLENRLLMDKFIQSTGANVSFAENGKKAIEELLDKEYDLLLLDIQMPIMNGIEVLEYIKSHDLKRNTKIFVLTADTQRENIQTYYSLGADGYLSKPISKKKILEIINGTD